MRVNDIDALMEVVKDRFEADGENLLEKVGLVEEQVPGVFDKAITDLQEMDEEQTTDYLVAASDFAKYRYLSQIKPDGHVRRLVVGLDQAVHDDSREYSIRVHAANCVMQTAVLTQQSKRDAAVCILEQVKFFITWHIEHIEKGKEQDV